MTRNKPLIRLTFSLLVGCLLPFSSWAQMNNSSNEKNVFEELEYRCIGPTRGGRVTTVTGVAQQTGVFYMGSTGGGVWKTEDFGANWKNVSDGYFATGSIGAIRVAPNKPELVYVGTGSDGIRSNVISGKGVYKSMDSGKTWKQVGLTNVGQIGAVEIHPEETNTVFVAAIGNAFAPNKERGVYRTKDGGTTWEQVLFVSDSTGAVDLEFAPNNPDIIYASMWRVERKPWTIISGSAQEGGIYKSEDGGDNWTKLENGLPDGIFGKCDLAVSPNDPNRLYALIEAPVGKGGVYRSDDQGASFQLVSMKKELLDRPFYYCNIDADPNNADVLYSSATRFFKSTDGGISWKRMATPHGDNHDVWIHPNDSKLFIQANDGGVNITRDGGKTWSTQHNQATAELYQVEVDDQFPYWIYAGQQDNSTLMLPSTPPYQPTSGATGFWQAVGGCETGPVVPKPGNHNIVYANCKGRFGVYNKLTGQEKQYYVGATNIYGHNPKDLKFRFQRVAPIHVSPHDPDVVYHGSQYLHKTTDDGQTWEIISPDLTAFEADKQVISGSPVTRDITGEEYYSTIYSIQESKIEKGLIWIGANDGPVHVTRDGGKNWANVTPQELPGGGRIDCVEPSVHQAGKAYFTSLRYQLGDWKPYIYRTLDFGKNWTLLTDGKNGIPADYPVRVVREDPNRAGLLYAGTEYGMFISMDDGANWMPFQQNLPITPITDIKVHQNDLVLSTMGRSFWILDDVTLLHQLKDTWSQQSAALFIPRDAYRMRYRGTSKSSIPYYPGPNVIINYWLKDEVAEVIQLDILDEAGNTIRTFKSKDPNVQEENTDEPSMATGYYRRGTNPELKNGSGIQRFRWDMRHKGFGKSNTGGPMVAPGAYKAKLTIGDQVFTESFSILMDPRVKESGITTKDLIAQEELALKVLELRAQTDKMAKKVSKALDKEPDNSKIQALDKVLNTAEGRYMKPMLVDQLRYLSSMIDRADQMPGKDAYERYEELKGIFDGIAPDFEKMFPGSVGSE